MISWDIECVKIVMFGLKLRTIRDAKSHTAEDVRHIAYSNRDGVKAARLIHSENITDYGTVTP